MWLANLSSASILIPMILGLFCLKSLSKEQKYFFLYIILSFVFEIISDLFHFYKINSHGLFKFILITDVIFFIWFNHKLGIPTKWIKIFIVAFVGFILVFFVIKSIFDVNILLDSIFYLSVFLFFIIQSANSIIHIFENVNLNPTSNFLFWISFARLMYFLIIFFIYIYPNLKSGGFENKLFLIVFGAINSIGNILGNILYGVSFLCRKTNN